MLVGQIALGSSQSLGRGSCSVEGFAAKRRSTTSVARCSYALVGVLANHHSSTLLTSFPIVDERSSAKDARHLAAPIHSHWFCPLDCSRHPYLPLLKYPPSQHVSVHCTSRSAAFLPARLTSIYALMRSIFHAERSSLGNVDERMQGCAPRAKHQEIPCPERGTILRAQSSRALR